jgi:hypothetical protein
VGGTSKNTIHRFLKKKWVENILFWWCKTNLKMVGTYKYQAAVGVAKVHYTAILHYTIHQTSINGSRVIIIVKGVVGS